jgi:hypothetical protein
MLRNKKSELDDTYANQKLMLEDYRKRAKEVMITTLSQLYAYKRREKQRPNPQLGYLKSSLSDDFIEGPMLLNLRTKEVSLSECIKDFKKTL